MEKQNSSPRNLYQMSVQKNRADEMVERFVRFYVKETTTPNLDVFVLSFYGQLDDWQIPWLDLPFYINSLQTPDGFPKTLRDKWGKQGLVGKPDLPDEEKSQLSVEYFMKNKQNIIQRYMDLLAVYLRSRGMNFKLLPLREAASEFDISEEQMLDLLNRKSIPQYEILDEIRVKESDLALLLVNCRLKKPTGTPSEVTFTERPKQQSENSTKTNPSPAKTSTTINTGNAGNNAGNSNNGNGEGGSGRKRKRKKGNGNNGNNGNGNNGNGNNANNGNNGNNRNNEDARKQQRPHNPPRNNVPPPEPKLYHVDNEDNFGNDGMTIGAMFANTVPSTPVVEPENPFTHKEAAPAEEMGSETIPEVVPETQAEISTEPTHELESKAEEVVDDMGIEFESESDVEDKVGMTEESSLEQEAPAEEEPVKEDGPAEEESVEEEQPIEPTSDKEDEDELPSESEPVAEEVEPEHIQEEKPQEQASVEEKVAPKKHTPIFTAPIEFDYSNGMDCLAMFMKNPLPKNEDEVINGEPDFGFPDGKNTFEYETGGNPPASPTYRNKQGE